MVSCRSLHGTTEDEILRIAFSLAKHSHHPLSPAVAEWENKKTQEYLLKMYRKKKRTFWNGGKTLILLGNKALLKQHNIIISPLEASILAEEAEQGRTPLLIAKMENS